MPTSKPEDGRNCQRFCLASTFGDVKIETKTGDLREEKKSGFHYCFLRPTEWETDVMIA